MIMICERCFSPIEAGESMVRLAHIDQAHPDGSVTWTSPLQRSYRRPEAARVQWRLSSPGSGCCRAVI